MLIGQDLEVAKELFLKSRLALFHPGDGDKEIFLGDPEIRKQFESQCAGIKKLLGQSAYFHGTGAFHYKNLGASKYDGTTDEINDSLRSFLTNGIVPQFDLFNEEWTKAGRSISLTKLPIYARIYASLYLNENEKLDYEYGSRAFWWRLLLTRMVVQGVTDPDLMTKAFMDRAKRIFNPKGCPDIVQRKKRKHQQSRAWTSGFRKDDQAADSPLHVFRTMETGKSDIPGNFPVIIGMRSEGVLLLPIKYEAVKSYEYRTDRVIDPANFTHLQVPINKVEEVRKRVKELGLQIPVVPIEFVEIINSDTSIKQLTAPHEE